METWKALFAGRIPKDFYEVQLTNGEENGLQIELESKSYCIRLYFGVVQAVRMLDEGIVQEGVYDDAMIEKYKPDAFCNVIYEVQDGEFLGQIHKMSGEYGAVFDFKHYLVITSNYVIDIVSQWEPTIEVKRRRRLKRIRMRGKYG